MISAHPRKWGGLPAEGGIVRKVQGRSGQVWVLNGGSAYGLYDVNWIPLTSNPMPAALLSDPMIRLTPIFDIGAVFWIDLFIDVALSHHQSHTIQL